MGIPTEVLAWPVSRAPKRPMCANLRLLPRAGECAEAPGSSSAGQGGCGCTSRPPPGQRARPTLPAVAPCRTLHTLPPPWGCPRHVGLPWHLPEGRALLSQPSPREHSTQFCTKSHKHNHCHTALTQLGTSLAIFCGRTQGRYPRTRTELGQWQAGLGGGLGNLGSGQASADLEQGPWVQGFLGNVHHGRPGPAEASSNGRLASLQGHSPHHLPSPANFCASQSHRSWRRGPGAGLGATA